MLGLAFSKFFTHAFHASCEVAEVRTRIVVACACWRDAVAAPVTRSAVSATGATVAARAPRTAGAARAGEGGRHHVPPVLRGFGCRRERAADRDRRSGARGRGCE